MRTRTAFVAVAAFGLLALGAPAVATPAPAWSVKGTAWVQLTDPTALRMTRADVAATGASYGATGVVYVEIRDVWWTLVTVAYARLLDDGRVLVTGPTTAAGGLAAGYTGWQYYHVVFDGKRAVVVSGGAEPGDGGTAATWIETAYDPFFYEPYPYVGPGSWPILRGVVTLRA